MKDVCKMLKCRALFLQSVAYMMQDNINMDDRFMTLLEGFMENYLEDNYDEFNLIYYFTQDEDGNLAVVEEPEWYLEVLKYVNYFRNSDNDKVIKLYDDIGFENVDKISHLAKIFWIYVMALNDMNKHRVRS